MNHAPILGMLDEDWCVAYLLVDLFDEFQLLFEGLSSVLSIDVVQCFVVQILKQTNHDVIIRYEIKTET